MPWDGTATTEQVLTPLRRTDLLGILMNSNARSSVGRQ